MNASFSLLKKRDRSRAERVTQSLFFYLFVLLSYVSRHHPKTHPFRVKNHAKSCTNCTSSVFPCVITDVYTNLPTKASQVRIKHAATWRHAKPRCCSEIPLHSLREKSHCHTKQLLFSMATVVPMLGMTFYATLCRTFRKMSE